MYKGRYFTISPLYDRMLHYFGATGNMRMCPQPATSWLSNFNIHKADENANVWEKPYRERHSILQA